MDNNKWCLSISDIYGTVPTVAPEGYEFTGEFRPPKAGEICRRAGGSGNTEDAVSSVDFNYGPSHPRLILRKKPDPKDVYTVSEEILRGRNYPGFEWTGEFRKLKNGEWFLSAPEGHTVFQVATAQYLGDAYRFVMRKLPTIKEVYGKELSELKAPEGYRFTGEFRIPDNYQPCLHPTGTTWISYPNLAVDKNAKPRLILEKIPANPTIEEVYGTANPVIPKGWRFKEFRQLVAGERPVYLGLGGWGKDYTFVFKFDTTSAGFVPRSNVHDNWRIILEEVQDLSQFKYSIGPETFYGTRLPEVPDGYRVKDFRPPQKGETFLPCYGGLAVALAAYETIKPRFILERR